MCQSEHKAEILFQVNFYTQHNFAKIAHGKNQIAQEKHLRRLIQCWIETEEKLRWSHSTLTLTMTVNPKCFNGNITQILHDMILNLHTI